jgi:hypothetical protein
MRRQYRLRPPTRRNGNMLRRILRRIYARLPEVLQKGLFPQRNNR